MGMGMGGRGAPTHFIPTAGWLAGEACGETACMPGEAGRCRNGMEATAYLEKVMGIMIRLKYGSKSVQ